MINSSVKIKDFFGDTVDFWTHDGAVMIEMPGQLVRLEPSDVVELRRLFDAFLAVHPSNEASP